MILNRGEPEFGPWLAVPLSEFIELLPVATGLSPGRPRIVAIDGRSSSGKTTLADRISRAVANSHVIHTDDIAWAHSRFDWTDLLSGVLDRLHQGERCYTMDLT